MAAAERPEIVTADTSRADQPTTEYRRVDLTVKHQWKVDKELADKLSNTGRPSNIIPIIKWIFTLLLAAAILVCFVATKVSFISLSVALNTTTPAEGISDVKMIREWAEYLGQFIIIYLVISVPYFILFLRGVWMGLCNHQAPWPSKSAVFCCILVGILEPLGIVLLSLKVLTKYSPSVGALIMSTVITWTVCAANFRSRKEEGNIVVKIILLVVGPLVFLAGVGMTVFIMIQEESPTLDFLHEVVCFLSLNIAWLPWLQRHMSHSKARDVKKEVDGQQMANSTTTPGHQIYGSMTASTLASTSTSTTSSGFASTSTSTLTASNQVHGDVQAQTNMPNFHINSDPFLTNPYNTTTWKASIVLYAVKIISTFIFCFTLVYVDTPFTISQLFSNYSHTAFLEAWDLDSSVTVSYTWTVFAVNLICGVVCYVVVYMAAATNMQRGCFGVPLFLSLPLTIVVFSVDALCVDVFRLDEVCKRDSEEWHILAGAVALLTIGQVLALGRHAFRREERFLLRDWELFWMPGYNGAILDSWLLLDRTKSIKEGRDDEKEATKACKPRVYICSTMYREDEDEMRQLLESIAKVNEAQAEGDTFFESHIVFDGGVSQKKLSPTSLILISLLEKTLGVRPVDCTKVITPYGMKLSWCLPTPNIEDNRMLFNIHLKDNALVKNKKRWSQVMYMSYILDFLRADSGPGEEPYILTTDADVKFTPESVEALLDLMTRDNSIGAVCARTHPMGSGPLVWYQIFEYAVGHWFQKAAEHVLGSVLCAPGCFSVYRCRALRDILPKYSKKVESAFDFLTKDMGEDRWLCTLMVQSGWRIEYCAVSQNETNCPNGFEEFYKQRRRWIASTLANLMLIVKEWKYVALFNHRVSVVFLFYQALLLCSTLIAPSTIILVVSGGLVYAWGISMTATVILQLIAAVLFTFVCIFRSSKAQMLFAKIYTFVYALVVCAVAVGTAEQIVLDLTTDTSTPNKNNDTVTTTTIKPINQHISMDIPVSITTIYFGFLVGIFLLAGLLHLKEFACLLHGVWYLLCLPSGYLILMLYSICNLTDSSWGTREETAHTTMVKKESWHSLYKRVFYFIFFCWKPAEADQEPEPDAEARPGSRFVHHASQESIASPDDGEDTGLLVRDALRGSVQSQVRGQGQLKDDLEVDIPISVEEWLPKELVKYADIFKKNGFENTMFIKGLTERELHKMGITKRGQVQHLLANIAILPAFEIECKVPETVQDWLDEIGLGVYRRNFWQNHIRTDKEMEILKRFDRKDIEKELGITKEGHIKRLLYAIRMLRDPSEAQLKANQMGRLIDDKSVHYLKESNVGEYEFWKALRRQCLRPDLKAFGIHDEISEKLVKLRNEWLMILAVANSLWLILILTLASKGNLTVLGANPIGLTFLIIYGFVFVIQFLAMLVHRVMTKAHFLARASYKCGKPLHTSWSFKDKPNELEDTVYRNALSQRRRDLVRAADRNNETRPLLSKTPGHPNPTQDGQPQII